MVARTLQITHYEVDKLKKEVVHADPRLEYNLKYNVPFPDEARVTICSSGQINYLTAKLRGSKTY